MLLSLAVSNYRSLKDEAVLDMQRRSFKTLRPRAGETWQENTWRRAAVFGANASGKSNLLRPLGLLNQAVKLSLYDAETTKALQDPHLHTPDRPTSFEVEYEHDDVRYRWILVLDREGIVEESLHANPEVQFRKVYERKRNKLSFGNKIGLSAAAKENISEFMRPWVLTLSAWLAVRNPGKYAGALTWWRTLLPLVLSDDTDQSARHEWLIELAHNSPKWFKALRTVARVADVGITDIDVAEHAPDSIHKLQLEFNSKGEPTVTTLEPSQIDEYLRYVLFVHGHDDKRFSLPEGQESRGTRTWMDLAIPALFALTVGGILAVDEIDGSLHPVLVRELVNYFNNVEYNPLGAQLIFSTHDLTLLGKHPAPALERGEVWFMEKSNTGSELIALDEFPVREAHNVEKRYLQGIYGAIPMTNPVQLRRTLDTLRDDYFSGIFNQSAEQHNV